MPCAVKAACTVRSGGKSALTAVPLRDSKSGGLPIAIPDNAVHSCPALEGAVIHSVYQRNLS